MNLITEIQGNSNTSIPTVIERSNHKILEENNTRQVSSAPKSKASSRVLPSDDHYDPGQHMTSTNKGESSSRMLPSNDLNDIPMTSTPKKKSSPRMLPSSDPNDMPMTSTPKKKSASQMLPSNDPNDMPMTSTPKGKSSSRMLPFNDSNGMPMTSTLKRKPSSRMLPSDDPNGMPTTSTPKGKISPKRSLFDEENMHPITSTPKSKSSSRRLPLNEDPNLNAMNLDLSLEEIEEISPTRNISNHRTLSKANTPRLPSSPSSISNADRFRGEALESTNITESRNPSKHNLPSHHDVPTSLDNTKHTYETSRMDETEDVPVTMHLRSVTNLDPPLSKSPSSNSFESILTPLSVKNPTETSSESRETSVQNEISAKSGVFDAYFPSTHQMPAEQISHQIVAETETNRDDSKHGINEGLSANPQFSNRSIVDQSAPLILGLQSTTCFEPAALVSVDSTISGSSQTLSKSTPTKSTDIEDIEIDEDQNEEQIIPALISMKTAGKVNSERPVEALKSKPSPKPFDNKSLLSIKDTMQVPNVIPEHTFKQDTFLQIPKELEGFDKNRSPVPKLDFSKLESSIPSPITSPKRPREAQFSFAVWRKRYMQFNNNDKTRVMEQLRALDQCSTGYIPNNEFIEHVLSTGFKTNRKELLQVVRLFDPNYEGRMDYCRFISCLRSIPGPNEEEEFNQMAAKWAKAGPRYKVESADPEYPVSEFT